MIDYVIYIRKVLVWLAITAGFTLTSAAVEQTALYQPGAQSVHTIEGYRAWGHARAGYLGTAGSGRSYYSGAYTGRQSVATYSASGLHTGSSAGLHSYGGMNNGGGSHYSGNSRNAASYGNNSSSAITIGSTSLAFGKKYFNGKSSTVGSQVSKRRIYEAGVSDEDGEGNYYDEEKEQWLPIPGSGSGHNVGDTDGKGNYWNGSEWVPINEVDTVPAGDMPWWLMLLMVPAYMFVANRKGKMSKTGGEE